MVEAVPRKFAVNKFAFAKEYDEMVVNKSITEILYHP